MGVLFPCDIDEWTEVARRLHSIQQTSSPSAFPSLQEIYELIHGPEVTPQGVKKPFQGLETFFKKEATYKEKTTFFQHTFPIIISHALQIETRKPEDGIRFSKQQNSGSTSISRQLAASIVACGFLCLWPRRKYDKHSTLCAINFDNFFCHLGNKGQCGKLRMILHYFERTSQDFLQGKVIFERKVVPQENLPTLDEWLHCEANLCDIQVHSSGIIEDAGPATLQVDFANKKLGGGVLSTGRVQEEIRFAACPELIAGMLFMEEMEDNEAIVMRGFLNYARYSGYAKDLAFVGPFPDPAQRDSSGNLDNHLVAMDACPARRIGGAEKQYCRENILRELNKAMVGFQQHKPKARQGSIGEVCKQYFSTLSETIFTKALGDVLTTQEPPPPPPPSLADHNVVRPRRRRSADSGAQSGAVRRNSGPDMGAVGAMGAMGAMGAISTGGAVGAAGAIGSGGAVSSSFPFASQVSVAAVGSGSKTGILPRGHSLDSPMVGSGMTGMSGSRRSSSEFGSSRRNSSSDSMSSRRGSSFSSSSSSRRSSSRKGSTECSDMEEYLQTIASRNQKPSVIEEEELVEDNPIQEFATGLVSSVLEESIPEVRNKGDSSASTPDELPLFSDTCPPDVATRPKAVSPPRQISHASLSQIFSYAGDITSSLLDDVFVDVQARIKDAEAKEKERKDVEPFVGEMLSGVWNEVLSGIQEGRVRVVQVDDDESDVEDIDLDLFMFVDDFVHGVMNEAIDAYKTEVKEEQKQLEEMLQRSRQKVETEAKYFDAEFSKHTDTSGPKIDRRKGSLNYVRGGLAREMMRRRSLDETGRRRSSGFKDKTLSSFEQELLSSHPNIPNFVLSSAGRRASEPMTRDDSIDTDFLSVASEKTRASSIESISRDYLQGWLENCQNLSGRSSRNRQRTSSSHLDWFAQDLVLDALDDAYVQLFGRNYTTRSNKSDMNNSTSSSSKDDVPAPSQGYHHHSQSHRQHLHHHRTESSHYHPEQQYHRHETDHNYHRAYPDNRSDPLHHPPHHHHHHQYPQYHNPHSDSDSSPTKPTPVVPPRYGSELAVPPRRGLELTNPSPSPSPSPSPLPIVTGNWGCGAFRGDPQLKSVLQWLAASRNGTPVLVYYTFGHEALTELESLCHLVSARGVTVGQVLGAVLRYCDRRSHYRRKGHSLFDVLHKYLS